MDLWAVVVIAGLAGFGLGALVVWWIGRRQVGGTSVSALKKEHEQFREQVTSHFVETAELINRMTDSYKDVFDHLNRGAETLVDDKSLRDRMPQVSDQEVRLKRIGTRSSGGAPSSDASKPGTSGRSSTASSPVSSASPATKAQASRASDAKSSSASKDGVGADGSAKSDGKPQAGGSSKTDAGSDSASRAESKAPSEAKDSSRPSPRSQPAKR